jgi:hypothetical protein
VIVSIFDSRLWVSLISDATATPQYTRQSLLVAKLSTISCALYHFVLSTIHILVMCLKNVARPTQQRHPRHSLQELKANLLKNPSCLRCHLTVCCFNRGLQSFRTPQRGTIHRHLTMISWPKLTKYVPIPSFDFFTRSRCVVVRSDALNSVITHLVC